MTEWNDKPQRKSLSARRLTLLASVAVVGTGLVIGGSLAHNPFIQRAVAAMPASMTQQCTRHEECRGHRGVHQCDLKRESINAGEGCNAR